MRIGRLFSVFSIFCVALSGAAQPLSSPTDCAGWHKNYTEQLQGANVQAALDLLKSRGLTPSGPVIVGIIDSGADTTNISLKKAFWTNPGERPDGRDNDGNGYVDDLHGWNFLGTKDGSFNMTSAGTEEYRQFKRLYPKYKHVTSRDSVAEKDRKEYDYYRRMRKAAKIDQYLLYYEIAQRSKENFDSLSLARLAEMEKNIYSIEHDKDKRLLMGDDMNDANDRYYGNPTLTIDGCEHGTFVAGIIGGDAIDDRRYSGIAEGVAQLMIVRASPDGDEYDKDVATSIRYAVDNGARVINISLGKYESPQARMVNEAIRYALDHDVVVVHAAGNNGRNLDSVAVYPAGTDRLGRFYENFIRVGSTDEQGRIAEFSNYGVQQVHLYAPGTMIASVMPGNKYDLSQGTSLSAPVVSAIVALLRSYFPYLAAPQIRQLLQETARPLTSDLSPLTSHLSPGTVDMLAAVRRLLDSPVDWYRAEAVSEKYVSGRVHALMPYPSWVDGTPYVKYEHADRKYMVDARTGKTEPYSEAKIDAYKQKHPVTRARSSFFGGNTAHTADSAFTMLGDKYNLYVRDNRSGEVRQLTTDGRELATYCNRGARDTLTQRNPSGFWRDHTYFCMVYDDTEVNDLNIVHSMSTPPRLEQKKMPLPSGNGTRQYHLFWYNADSGEARQLPITPARNYFVQLDYDKTGDSQYFLRRSPSVDTLELCRIDVKTGKVNVVISEVCKPHVNVNMFKYHLLDHGRQVLWWSDRSGRGNYYLYDGRTGRLLNRVTQGERLVAGRIEQIDTLGRTIIFQGYGQEGGDPHYTYYYKVNFDGKNQQLLTYGLGEHEISLSADGRYAIDQYSRMDMPPVWNVVDVRNPKKHHEFFRTSESEALKAGWVKPILVKVKATDEQTDLYGVMYLPSDSSFFIHHSSFPVITNVYPGPQDDQIPRRFTVDENGNQTLAELGFVVINVQTRGSSPLRDKDFYNYGYGNLRDYPLADTRHTIEALAKEYPFFDLDRVGIYGHSGGGFQTVAAMLQDPDFYKVGIAASGNHDNNVYINWWADTYQGYGKPIPTNMELASRLKGRLLLMTGEVDENVPVASTIRMADALQKAGKRFDMMIFPEQGHGLMGDYYMNIIRNYFLDHLVAPKQEDIDIVKHQ
jgi:dipeptidyl aminopeptidase/acylaminoacyl peptidase/subtilisin family serine protease